MFKTSIQLVLLSTLILIIFFISQKYFYTEDSINESNNTITLNKSENSLSKKNSEKSNNNEIINLTFEKFDSNGNMYLIKDKKGILAGQYNINMSIVEASLIYTNNEKLTIYSNEAVFHKETFKTIF